MARILLIEDQSFTASLIMRVLGEAGHAVDWHKDGRAGLVAFKATQPDLVITDLIMPDVDGIEVIRSIRAEAHSFPIIAISGGGPSETFNLLDAAKTVGATIAIRKPVSQEQLLEAVEDCLIG